MTWNLAWGLGLVVLALALGALRADLSSLSMPGRAWKAVRVLVLAVGISVALGLVPIPAPPGPDEAPGLTWRQDVEQALAEAREAGRMAILDAGAEWCAACKELEHRTFRDPAVVEALRDFVAIRIDMTDFDPAQRRLQALGIEVSSLPYVAFFLPDGRLNPGVTLRDYESPSAFVRRIAQARTWQDEGGGPVARWLAEKGILWAMLLALLAGIGVSLTPCVYPMIPVTLGVLGARGAAEGSALGIRVLRAAVFVLGMVLTYATLGVASALLGKGFGSWIQHPAVTLTMATLFAALALSYLGFFSLDLPEGLKARMGARRGGLLGLALVGGTTGLLAAPCAGPVVVGILAVVSATQSVALGLALMLAFGTGLGLLFFVLGVSTALVARRPRSGPWMERIEILLATGLLVVALYYGRLGLSL